MQTSGAIIVAVAAAAGGYFSWGVLVDAEKNRPIEDDSGTSSATFGSEPEVNFPDSGSEAPNGGGALPDQALADAEPAKELPVVLLNLSPSEFPEKVKLLQTVDFTYRDDTSVPPVPYLKDSFVVPLKLEGGMLTLTPSLTGSLRATVPYTQTDFLARVEAMKNAPPVEGSANKKPKDETLEEIDLIGEEAAVAKAKKDILSGRISELKANQVKKFDYQAAQKIKGDLVEVVLVEFNAETLLGEKRVSARAIIVDGEIDRWEWAATGFEMR